MSKATSNKALIAQWTIEQDLCDDPPAKVFWQDGTPATLNDFVRLSLATHTYVLGEDGVVECRMYPDILGLPGEICTSGNETNWYGRSLEWRKGRSTGRNRS